MSEYFTLCEESDGTVWLWGHGEYPESSVLAGQDRHRRIEAFDSMAEARKAHRDVEAGPGPLAFPENLSELAPRWFDPADAGEAWGEDDY